MTQENGFRLIRIQEVQYLTGLSRSTIYAYIQQGEFPASVSLGKRSVAWVSSEVKLWIQSRVEQSRAS